MDIGDCDGDLADIEAIATSRRIVGSKIARECWAALRRKDDEIAGLRAVLRESALDDKTKIINFLASLVFGFACFGLGFAIAAQLYGTR
jgi:hypothetical protein